MSRCAQPEWRRHRTVCQHQDIQTLPVLQVIMSKYSCALTAAFALAASSSALAQTQYECEPLQLSDADIAFAYSINNQNVVGGSLLRKSDDSHSATLWARRKPRELPKLSDSRQTTVYGINDNGVAVGVSINAGWDSLPVIWRSGRVEALPLLPKASRTKGSAVAVNLHADTVGTSFGADSSWSRAVLWRGGKGKAIRLGALANSEYSYATGINDSGVIVGYDHDFFAQDRAVRWDVRTLAPTELKNLPGDDRAIATAVNQSGVVIGYGSNAETQMPHAVAWVDDGVQALRMLAGGNYSTPNGINNQGVVVGLGSDSTNVVGVVWPSLDEAPVDLNKLLVGPACDKILAGARYVNAAYGVNDAGAIVATSIQQESGITKGIRLIPRTQH